MNLGCIILKISIVLCFFPPAYFAQGKAIDTSRFYIHLKQNHLFNEQLVFNKDLQKTASKNPIITDSLQLDRAVIFYQLNLPDSCRNILSGISNHFSPTNEGQNQKYLSMLIVNKEYAIAQNIINKKNVFNTSSYNYHKNIGLSIAILKRELDKKDSIYNSFSVSPSLFEIKTRYLNPPKFSPAIAGVYSALIPGLGKLYIGYKNQALTSFIANMLLAAQATESYFKSGPASARFIITAGVFSVFYTGNIIGSIAVAKKKKRDYFKQLDDEIFNYYVSDLTRSIN